MKKNPKKLITKNFPLTTLAIENGTSVMILAFIVVIFGALSYVTMPKESYPEVVIPQVYVGTSYPGNSPVDMENLITRPIEKELKSISNVKDITSTSIQDYSTIIVEFVPGVEISKVLQDTKDAVDKAKSELPNDLDQEPEVFELNYSELPIMYVNLSGDFTVNELKAYGEELQDEIEKLSEISYVDLQGSLEREIRIDADLYKMKARQVSFGDISSAIASENITISGGNIRAGEFRRSIRVVGEFKTVKEIEKVVVKSENGNPVFLKDVADVRDTEEEAESYARLKQKPVVTLNVVKRSGQNILDATDKIKALLENAQANTLPKELDVTITIDQAKVIRFMVSNLENSIISGVILVVLVLLFFMGLRSAIFVGIAIPLSMFISFIILNAFGVTLNMMVLFSLILALGMLVDNGIVVIENIYRLLEEGYPIKQAVKEGVGEIALPIIASTLTTVVAFLPLAFWDGVIGSFMRFLPITLMVVLAASLFVGLVINPAVALLFARLENDKPEVSRRTIIIALSFIGIALPLYFFQSYFFANLLMAIGVFTFINVFLLSPASRWFQNRALVWLENIYSKLIFIALSGWRPYVLFGGTLLLLYASIIIVGNSGIKASFFPETDPNYINVFIEKPIGTDIEETDSLTQEIEEKVIKLMEPYDYLVEAVIAQVGKGTNDPVEGPSPGVTPHKAKVLVSFKEFKYRRGQSTSELVELIRENVQNYPGAQIIVAKEPTGPPVGPPINIEISGENYEKLIKVSNNLKSYIEEFNIPGIEELRTDLQEGKPELIVNVDREKAGKLGVTTYQVADELRTALFGREVSKFKDGEDDYPIQLRLKDEQRYNLDALKDKDITFRNNTGELRQIPISAVADLEYTSSLGSVKREDLDRVISIFSNVKEGYNGNEIVAQLKNLVATYDIPSEFDVKFTGEQEEQDESSTFLLQAFLFALFMVFLIIVTQFNSLSAPIVIMCSVVFSTIGVLLGLSFFKMDFIILMTGIGIISLAGVVVNNAIVLIDYTNLLRNRRKAELGLEKEDHLPSDEFLRCIVEAGKKRLRPVLLTAITTILGLIPLAVGLNIDFYKLLSEFDPEIYFGGDSVAFFSPMAWTVIFGLSFATFLTLVIVPVMYLLTDKLKFRKKAPKREMNVSI